MEGARTQGCRRMGFPRTDGRKQDSSWAGEKMGDGGEREKVPLLLPVNSASKIQPILDV